MATIPMEIRGAFTHAPVVTNDGTIQCDRASKVYRDGEGNGFAALAEVSLHIPPASAALIEGPSGSGKSTLLGLMGGMVRPTAGRVYLSGRDLTRLHEEELAELRRRACGFVFQSHSLIRGLSALDNVMLPAIPCPERNGDLIPSARRLLRFLALEERAGEKVERLSGGEQQRVALARAMINAPRFVLADEPTAYQDELGVRRFLEFVEQVVSNGTTVVVTSHDPAVCESKLFRRRIVLRGGRVVSGEGMS